MHSDAPRPVDEGRHTAGEGRWWQETWWFDVFAADGAFGACTWTSLLPGQRRAWYWSMLVRAGEPVLHVVDLDVRLPPAPGLTLRSAGLWAEHVCEEPFVQWTVANECYAVALDDPAEALGRAYGRQEPVAFDIEWYATTAAEPTPSGYVQAGEAHGVIELSGGALPVEASARRGHCWGEHDWTQPGGDAPTDGARAPVRLDVDGVAVALEQVLTNGGWRRWWRLLG